MRATTIYLDQLFFWNTLADFLLLAAVQRLLGLPVHTKRTILAALAGGGYAVLSVLPGLGWLGHPIGKLAAALGLVAMVFGRAAHLPRYWLLFLVTACGLAGAVAAVGGAGGQIWRQWPLFLAAFLVCYGVLSLVFPGSAGQAAGQAELLSIHIHHNGRETHFKCLLDTGNSLISGGKPVLVVWRQALLPVLAGVKELYPLSYQSLGNPTGVLLCFTAERVTVGKRVYTEQPVAISPSPLSDGMGYVALWNERRAAYGAAEAKIS